MLVLWQARPHQGKFETAVPEALGVRHTIAHNADGIADSSVALSSSSPKKHRQCCRRTATRQAPPATTNRCETAIAGYQTAATPVLTKLPGSMS